MKKLLLALLLVLLVMTVLVLARTARHTPQQVESLTQLEIALDEERIAAHLSEAIQFQTVSHGNPEQIDSEAFEEFIAWVATTYPEVSQSMTLTRHGEYTMLYRWAGESDALAPILLTGHYDVVPVIPGTEELWSHPPFAGRIVDDRLSATTFGNAMLRTTTAATMLSASIKVNVLPIEAIATVNFRLHPRDSVEGVVEYVKSVVETERIKVRQASSFSRPASKVSNSNSPGYKAIERAVREIYGDVIVAPGLMVAGSDSRHYGKVADNAFRFNPMTVSPEDLTGFHGTNEKISVKNLAEGTRTYAQIIRHGATLTQNASQALH
jgi:carboxypeptidase PM20D1